MILWMGCRVEIDESAWLEPNVEPESPACSEKSKSVLDAVLTGIFIAEAISDILLQFQ